MPMPASPSAPRSRLQYRRDGQHVANMAYRYRRDSLEEIDASAAWPLTDRWSAVGAL